MCESNYIQIVPVEARGGSRIAYRLGAHQPVCFPNQYFFARQPSTVPFGGGIRGGGGGGGGGKKIEKRGSRG